ncbi:MAG: thiamine diphosphokinase [Firmicutes bacterium]|nr:thiamine diphosphokinase [Bacillota bacterium]
MIDKIKIFSGPNNYTLSNVYYEETDELIVGIDSGLEYLIDSKIHIDLAIGDFDSIEKRYLDLLPNRAEKIIQLPAEKNMTDLAYAIDYLYNNFDYKSIEIYGGIGGRIDHLFANVNLLKRFQISFRDDQHLIFVLKKGKHKIEHYFKYISFFAIEDVFELNIKGFKYELDNYFLSTSDSVCVSNEGTGMVEFSKGRLMIVCSNEK